MSNACRPAISTGVHPSHLAHEGGHDADPRCTGKHRGPGIALRAALVSVGVTALVVVVADALVTHFLVTTLVITGTVAVVSYYTVRRSLRSLAAMCARAENISDGIESAHVELPCRQDEAFMVTTLNRLLDRIEASRDAQRRFIGDASHELRNPLSIIMAALELAHLYPHALDDELSSGALLHEARRMHLLVEDLLLLARADSDDLSLTMNPIDLDVLAVEAANRLIDEPGPDVVVHVDAAAVRGDAQALSRAVDELLDNARRHATTNVEIVVAPSDCGVLLSVADDGPGMTPSERIQAMQRFTRLDVDRARDGGGTGLGLAVACEIVTAHGGTLVLGDRSGGGTTATVSLPAW